jgi:hypothetical protein
VVPFPVTALAASKCNTVAPVAPSSSGVSASQKTVIGAVVGILSGLVLLAVAWLWRWRRRHREEMSLLDKCSSIRRPPPAHDIVAISASTDFEAHTQSYKDQSQSVEDDGDLLLLNPPPVLDTSLDRA